MIDNRLIEILNEKADYYNRPSFITDDPISILHRFSLLQDIEISAFWTAILSWGQRKTIIQKANELFNSMDNAPYDFIMNSNESDLVKLTQFKHRTFLTDDTIYFIHALKKLYTEFSTMEESFLQFGLQQQPSSFMKRTLEDFHHYFFSLEEGFQRTKKHLPNPAKGSAAKRLNMFMRWMVRKDDRGVDFGLWNKISPSCLMIPYDLHVDRVARHYKLISRNQKDWQTVEDITQICRTLDAKDPAKYDFALFGISVSGQFTD